MRLPCVIFLGLRAEPNKLIRAVPVKDRDRVGCGISATPLVAGAALAVNVLRVVPHGRVHVARDEMPGLPVLSFQPGCRASDAGIAVSVLHVPGEQAPQLPLQRGQAGLPLLPGPLLPGDPARRGLGLRHRLGKGQAAHVSPLRTRCRCVPPLACIRSLVAISSSCAGAMSSGVSFSLWTQPGQTYSP